MGTFAILSPRRNFAVDQCHINFWIVDNRFSKVFLDVGLMLSDSGTFKDQIEFDMLLPFQVKKQVKSLSTDIRNSNKISQLLFNTTITSVKRGSSVYNVEQDKVVFLDVGDDVGPSRIKLVRNDDKSNQLQSYWNLILPKVPCAAEAGEDIKAYLRIRFEVDNPAISSTWIWHSRMPFIQRKRSGIFDFRVLDPRGIAFHDNYLTPQTFSESAIAVKKLRVFVVVPSRLQHYFAYPSLRHVRRLESDKWSEYLETLPRNRAFVAYYWKKDEMIDKDNPYLVHLELTHDADHFFQAFTEIGSFAIWVVLVGQIFGFETLLNGMVTVFSTTAAWAVAAIPFLISYRADILRIFFMFNKFLRKKKS
ncbi:MAG: hypothetical protein AB1405_07735 [Bdellovibrionota bacterium]